MAYGNTTKDGQGIMRTLFVDIETGPIQAFVWQLWQQNVSLNQIISGTHVLNWAAGWLGEDDIMHDSLHYHDLWKTEPDNDRIIIQSIRDLLDEADVVVGHNAARFDLPTINARCLYHGIPQPSKYHVVDTLKIAKSKLRLPSNKLDYLAQYLKVGKKIDTGGFDLWRDIVLNQDTAAFDKMNDYCIHDTEILELVYKKLAPLDDKHPAMFLLDADQGQLCNICGSAHLHRKGFYHTKTQVYQKYQCMSCGHNMRSRYAEEILDRDDKRNILRSN